MIVDKLVGFDDVARRKEWASALTFDTGDAIPIASMR
jgi:hypothetical protein